MNWPTAQDFNEAVQNPGTAFADPDLKSGEAVVGPTGLPMPRSGNFADVYQFRTPSGRDWAVKCFTRYVPGLDDRYRKISAALERANLPFTIGFSYLAEGIRVRGEWLPVLKMEWVEGLQLNQFVREYAGKPHRLDSLSALWVKLCRRLREAGVAHADIQHGNVLLVDGSRAGSLAVKLIDYDGMFVRELEAKPSGELGHPCFQHPMRGPGRVYSLNLDRFPALVVAAAVKGVSVLGPDVWEKYDTGDNLLFTEADFKNPASSELMRELWAADDPGLRSLVGHLALSCKRPMTQTPWLDDLAPDGVAKPLSAADARAAAEVLGVPAPAVPRPPVQIVDALPFPFPVIDAQPLVVVPVVDAQPLPPPPAVETVMAEIVGDARPAPRRQPKPVARPASRRPLAVVAGVLLAVGAAVGAVVTFGGKKSEEVTQVTPEPEPSKPVVEKVSPKPPEMVGPKPVGETEPTPPVTEIVTPKKIDPPPTGALVTLPPPAFPPPPPARPVWTKPGSPRHLGFSRDGRVLFTIEKNAIEAHDAATGERVGVPLDPTTMFGTGAANLFPLGGGLVAAGYNGAVRVWDTKTGKLVHPPRNIRAAGSELLIPRAVSPDGRFAFAAALGRRKPGAQQEEHDPAPFRLLDLADGSDVLAGDCAFGQAWFTADSRRLLLTETSGRVRWIDLPSGAVREEYKLPRVSTSSRARYLSDDGAVILNPSAGEDPAVRAAFALDARTGKAVRKLSPDFLGSWTRVGADGRRFAETKTDYFQNPLVCTVVVRDIETGAVGGVGTFKFRSGVAPAFEINPDLQFFALHDRDAGTVGVYQIATFTPGAGAKTPAPKPADVAAAPKGGDPAPLKPTWAAKTPRNVAHIEADKPNQLVFLYGNLHADNPTVLDTLKGAAVTRFTGLTASSLFVTANNRIVTHKSNATECQVWSGLTRSRVSIKRPVPDFGPPVALAPTTVFVSPNGKFMVACRNTPYRTQQTNLPLVAVDTSTGKKVVDTTWASGSVHFTADSSRVLVAERSGRCRWFKLSNGDDDGGWVFPNPGPAHAHEFYSMSDDGSVIGYGGPGGKGGARGSLLLDGATGDALRALPEAAYSPHSTLQVSGDGRRAAVLRNGGPGDNGRASIVDILDTGTGEVVARAAKVGLTNSVPTYRMTRDGRSLFIHEGDSGTFQMFDLPADPKGAK